MEVGDLIKVSDDWHELDIHDYGIALRIYPDPCGELGGLTVSVLWANGNISEEFFVALEVVSSCK